jgi:hypothetical protein
MAAINLAGAIGMTGKRESVLSDLPAYIKDTGDYLAARNEQRRKEEAAKKAKEQEWENNQQENFSKNVSANLGSRVQGFNEKYEKYAQNEMAKAYTAHLNPNLTLNQKQKAREEAHNNIANAKSIYLNAEKDVDKKINPIVNDDKFASQEALDYIYGKRPTVSSELTNTQPVEFMGEKPATAPMEGATGEESRKVTTTHNKPLYEMNHEEIAKDYENGVAAKVLPMVRLHETSLDKIAAEAIPSKPDFIKIVKNNINGKDEITKTINEKGMVDAIESIYTNIITTSGKEATRMYNKLHQDAYIASKDNKNITNEQDREAFMDDYIKEHALGAAKTWVKTEYDNQEMANENIDKTPIQNSTYNITNNYGNQQELPRKTQGNEEIIIDTKNAELANQNHTVYLTQKGYADEALKNADNIKAEYGEKSKEYKDAMVTANGHLEAQQKARKAQFAYEAKSKLKGGKKINVNPTATKTLNLTVKDDNGNDVVKAVDFSELRGVGDKVFIIYNEKKGGDNKDEFDTRFQEVTKRNESELDDSQVFGKKGEWRPQVIDYLNKNKSSKQTTPTKKEAPKKEEAKKVDLRKKYNY